MTSVRAFIFSLFVLSLSPAACAQVEVPKPKITMGNGESNSIQMEGLSHSLEESTFSSIRVDGKAVSAFRGTTTALTFPEVVIEGPGWLVLHPVINGRPDGDMVSGFAYLSEGQNKDVTIQIDHPADAGDKFLVMLHSD